jgi:hypothetical protein
MKQGWNQSKKGGGADEGLDQINPQPLNERGNLHERERIEPSPSP